MLEFGDLVAGMRLSGVVADGDVTVVAVDVHGPGSATLTYRTTDGRLGERIVFSDDLVRMAEASGLWVPETLPWSLTCRDGGRC